MGKIYTIEGKLDVMHNNDNEILMEEEEINLINFGYTYGGTNRNLLTFSASWSGNYLSNGIYVWDNIHHTKNNPCTYTISNKEGHIDGFGGSGIKYVDAIDYIITGSTIYCMAWLINSNGHKKVSNIRYVNCIFIAQPTLTSPNNNVDLSEYGNYLFRWGSVTNATKYEIQFTNITVESSENSYLLDLSILPDGSNTWKVTAINENGTGFGEGQVSVTRTFTK